MDRWNSKKSVDAFFDIGVRNKTREVLMLRNMLRYKAVATVIVVAIGLFALPVQGQTGLD